MLSDTRVYEPAHFYEVVALKLNLLRALNNLGLTPVINRGTFLLRLKMFPDRGGEGGKPFPARQRHSPSQGRWPSAAMWRPLPLLWQSSRETVLKMWPLLVDSFRLRLTN